MKHYNIRQKLFWFMDLKKTYFKSESDLEYEVRAYEYLFHNRVIDPDIAVHLGKRYVRSVFSLFSM